MHDGKPLTREQIERVLGAYGAPRDYGSNNAVRGNDELWISEWFLWPKTFFLKETCGKLANNVETFRTAIDTYDFDIADIRHSAMHEKRRLDWRIEHHVIPGMAKDPESLELLAERAACVKSQRNLSRMSRDLVALERVRNRLVEMCNTQDDLLRQVREAIVLDEITKATNTLYNVASLRATVRDVIGMIDKFDTATSADSKIAEAAHDIRKASTVIKNAPDDAEDVVAGLIAAQMRAASQPAAARRTTEAMLA